MSSLTILFRFLFTCSKDMTVKMYSLRPIDGFRTLTLAGHRNHVVACFIDEDLKVAESCCIYGCISSSHMY